VEQVVQLLPDQEAPLRHQVAHLDVVVHGLESISRISSGLRSKLILWEINVIRYGF
jgi:hypothetical protein